MSRRLAVFVFFGSVACGSSEPEIEFLAFPEAIGDARSAVFATREGSVVTNVQALDLESGTSAWRSTTEGGALLEALFYQDALPELGLEAGPILQGPSDSRRGLPMTSVVFELQLTESGPSADGWVPRDGKSPALEAFRLPEDGSECPSVHVSNHALPGNQNGVMAARLPSGEVLLGDTSGQVWLTNGPELRPVVRTGGDFGLTSMAVAPDTNELYFGTSGGFIYRGTLENDVLGVDFVDVADAQGYLRFLDVVSSSVGLELYAMSTFGEVLHLEDGSWTTLYDFERSGGFAGLQGFVRIDSPSGPEILAVAAEDNRVASIENGVVTMQDSTSASGLVEIAYVEGLGPVVGNDRGQMFARIDGRWQLYGPTGLATWLLSVTSAGPELIVYAAAFGSVGLIHRGMSCGAQQLLPADPFWLVPVGPLSERRFIAFGDQTGVGDLWYSEIRIE